MDARPEPAARRIGPMATSVGEYFREFRSSLELMRVLIRRDITVRYKQTMMGVGWAFLNPVLSMLVYSFVFGYLARLPSEGLPYPVFVFAALLPWQYMSRVMSEGGQSMSVNANLITKIYFPRLILPVSVALSALVDLMIGLLIVALLAPVFGYWPSWNIVLLPLYWAFAAITALAVAVWIAPLEVRYRDVRFLLPIFVQIWMLLSPVLYPATMIPEPYRLFYELNPVAVVAQGFRWSLFGHGSPPGAASTAMSFLLVAAAFAGGLAVFFRSERLFADRI